jgi:hypothetical protein
MKADLVYELYAHGQAPAGLSAEDRSRITEIARADAEFLVAHPAASVLADLSRKRRRVVAARAGIAACLALALLGIRLSTGEDTTRVKGGELGMFVYRKTAAGAELLDAKTALAEGDEIQIAYNALSGSYAAILSVDGRGAVTRHMPLHGNEALEVGSGGYSLLPYSYRLDDAPFFEDLYLIVSPRPFEVGEAEALIAEGKGRQEIRVPSPYRATKLRIRKLEAKK